jgi:DNA-directed RNA polymerase subunit beta'
LLETGTFATSDLNNLYQRVIDRSNRLRKIADLNAPEVILRNEKRQLQLCVDALFDNATCERPVLGSRNRPLVSISGMILQRGDRRAGLREGLLRRTVDYSARTRVVVADTTSVDEALLPARLGWELFYPMIRRELVVGGETYKSSDQLIRGR